jgi:RNA polymerase sigma-70 factor (ECF subfamily)
LAGNHGKIAVSQPRVTAVTQPLFDRTQSIPTTDVPGAVDPDRELVESWRKGEAEAFATLVRRHQRRVFGLLLRMLGNREEAEDAAQDTFLNLHRHGHRFRQESRFSTFVYRVAVNAALNRRRSLGRRRAHSDAFNEAQSFGHIAPAAEPDPERALAGDELRARLGRELLTLPEALRAPVVLFDVEGLSYGEIADVLEVAEGTVKSRIHRARQALRARLGDLVAERESGW